MRQGILDLEGINEKPTADNDKQSGTFLWQKRFLLNLFSLFMKNFVECQNFKRYNFVRVKVSKMYLSGSFKLKVRLRVYFLVLISLGFTDC